MLNFSLDLQFYSNLYREKGYVVISNFLEEHFAEFIEAEFKAIPYEDWINIIGDSSEQPDYRKPGWTEEFVNRKDAALREYRYGRLAYSYKRYDIVSNFRYATYMLSSEFKNFTTAITGETPLLLGKTGVYKHVENDYIARYQYGALNSIGYIFNVTKRWEADYGGLLYFQDIYTRETVLVEPGQFNSLIIFDVDRIQNVHRSFSRVNVSEEMLSRVYIEGIFTKVNT